MTIKIHLKDFPDNIAIALHEDIRNKLFSKFKSKNFTQKLFCYKLSISQNTFTSWKKGKTFLPMFALKEIIKNFDNQKYWWNLIENNVSSYKTKSGEINAINNPVFPIKDSPSFREIVLHLMADGSVESYAGYYNYENSTKLEFIEQIKNVFGDCEYKIYPHHVHFSMTIPHILSHYLNIDFHGKRCRIPQKFFNGNREKLIAILRAMIIDEGTIDNSNVRIDSSNKPFLNDVKSIALKLDYKCGKIWESKGPIFRFNILAESVEKLYLNIRPLPIKKKENQLILACESRNRKWKYFIPGTTKLRIITELLKHPKSSVELSWKLNMHRKMLNYHAKWLKSKGIIEVSGKSIYAYIWQIKDRNKAKSFINNPEIYFKDKKIMKWGVTQLKTLQALKRKELRLKQIIKETKIGKSAAHKMLKSLVNKGFISKNEKTYYLTSKGTQLLYINKNIVRFILYSNMKDLKDSNKIDLGLVGNF